MTINVKGPDGSNLAFPDGTPEAEITSAMDAHYGGGGAPAQPQPAQQGPASAADTARSFATGVPVVGGLLNKIDAATNAALAPLIEPHLEKGPETLDQPTFGERYRRSLQIQNERDARFAREHPIVDTAAKLAGGVASTVPAVLAAPKLMGAAGTLPQMVRSGATSGAAISAADAATRGEDIPTGAAIGAGLGAGAPLIARGIGEAANLVRSKPAPVPQHTVRVGNVDVPMRPDQMAFDPAASSEAELTLRGARGDSAQTVAQGHQDAQTAALQQASDEIAGQLGAHPATARIGASANFPGGAMTPGAAGGGAAPVRSPVEAASRVVDELTNQEATRLATEQAATARTAAEGAGLRASVGGPARAGAEAADPYTAAESVGAGVAQRRAQRVATTRGLYEDLANEPGAFDPEFVGGLSGDVRGKLASGDDPLHVDPQSSPRAHQALGVLDSLDGLGLFANSATPRAPVGPVAQAATGAAARSEAERAYSELVARGINPDRARAAASNLPGGQSMRGALEPHEVSTADGKTIGVAPKVVEASEIKVSSDPGFDQSLQPRNRGRAASQMQINDMARNLNPNRLGVSSEADRGAPIIGPDGAMESGNGRVMAIRQAYAENGPAADRYRRWLASQGVDVSKYREPVLVRERTTPMTPEERRKFVVSANQAATLSLSAPERALADAQAITPEMLSLIRNPGDLGAAENRDFVRAFLSTLPQAEHGALSAGRGELSAEGLTRLRNAVLAKAYGDSPILSRVAEAAHDDVKSISNGLAMAAPEWARLRAGAASGAIPADLDITKDLLDAVNRTAAIRGRGIGLAESKAQADAFATQSPESEALQRLFYDADGKRAASSQQIANGLSMYVNEAGKVNPGPGLNLGLPPVKASDVLRVANKFAGAPAELSAEVKAAAQEAAAAAPAAKGPPIGEVSLRDMENARKRLVKLYGQARQSAFGPTGNRSDMFAMARILNEFDQSIIGAFEEGRFSGDSENAARLLREARASHSLYRQTFSSRGGSDPVGRAVEKILGRYADTAATPDEIAKLSYGSAAEPGGGDQMRVAQRLRTILGENSPEWGAYKQGLVSFLTEPAAGSAPRSFSEQATRIERFLDGTKGRGLSQVVFSAEERAALRNHAENLRRTEPRSVGDLSTPEKIVARMSGRDGGIPMTPGQVVDQLFSRNGRGTEQGAIVAQQLKRQLSPERWNDVRLGMWQKLTQRTEGLPPYEAQALNTRITEFLQSSMAKSLYSPAERQAMAQLAAAYRQIIPPKGTVNTSYTAPMLAKIANRASNHVLTLLGGLHGGFTGAAVGYGMEKAGRAALGARNARKAVPLFYGPQPRPAVVSSRLPSVLLQSAAPQVANQ